MRERGYMFTWNNYTEASIEYLRSEISAKYICWGKELAPTTGTPHLQGYVYFPSMKSLSQVRDLLPGCHITPCSVDNGIASYCGKDGEFEEHGERPVTKKRKGEMESDRWEDAKRLCIEGRIEDLPGDIYMRFYRTAKEIAKDHMPPVASVGVLNNRWVWGPTGTGKTSSVMKDYPECYLKTANKWWDGYQGEDVVLIDDLDESHRCLVHHLKIWGDHKPFLAETKGGMLKIRPKTIICTSNIPLSSICIDSKGESLPIHLDALKRRYPEEYLGCYQSILTVTPNERNLNNASNYDVEYK